MRGAEKLTTTKTKKVRLHPASPALISWPLNDGTLRFDITVETNIGSLTFVRKGSQTS